MADVILLGKQAVFVAEYVANELTGDKLPAYQVAIRAGVAEKNAAKYAAEALANPKIQAAIAERRKTLTEQATNVDAAIVLREWAQIALGDRTQIVKARRLNCRYCWGADFQYQRTDAEFARESADAMQLGDDLAAFRGGPGFRHTRDPHPSCPECDGEGIADVHIADFRKLTDAQRSLIAGVKMGKHGIEVQLRDPDAALRNLAQYLGLLVNKNEHAGPGGGPIPHANVNYTLPSDPQEAARAYQMLMEGKV